MGKLSLIIYITVAALVVLLISRSPNRSQHSRNRRLRLRSNFTFASPADRRHLLDRSAAAAFDPLVAEIERKREDRQWEHHYFQTHHPEFRSESRRSTEPEWEDFIDAEDYLNDEEKFNVTDRLVLLFPKIDVDPVDGFVSERELSEWNLQQGQKEVFHRTEREMEVHDKNKDGFVSLQEYEPPSWVRDSGWWKEEHFNASDVDGDGLLSLTEFNDFLHPADTNNPKLLGWLCQEEIRERDTDRDGKVNFEEFFHGHFDLVRNYDEGVYNASVESDEATARTMFNQLDKDDDGYLSVSELLPIIGKIHPSERFYAKQQTEYMLQQADTDKDGRLTLTEMIDNPYVFYSAVFDEEEDEDYAFHDEFR